MARSVPPPTTHAAMPTTATDPVAVTTEQGTAPATTGATTTATTPTTNAETTLMVQATATTTPTALTIVPTHPPNLAATDNTPGVTSVPPTRPSSSVASSTTATVNSDVQVLTPLKTDPNNRTEGEEEDMDDIDEDADVDEEEGGEEEDEEDEEDEENTADESESPTGNPTDEQQFYPPSDDEEASYDGPLVDHNETVSIKDVVDRLTTVGTKVWVVSSPDENYHAPIRKGVVVGTVDQKVEVAFENRPDMPLMVVDPFWLLLKKYAFQKELAQVQRQAIEARIAYAGLVAANAQLISTTAIWSAEIQDAVLDAWPGSGKLKDPNGEKMILRINKLLLQSISKCNKSTVRREWAIARQYKREEEERALRERQRDQERIAAQEELGRERQRMKQAQQLFRQRVQADREHVRLPRAMFREILRLANDHERMFQAYLVIGEDGGAVPKRYAPEEYPEVFKWARTNSGLAETPGPIEMEEEEDDDRKPAAVERTEPTDDRQAAASGMLSLGRSEEGHDSPIPAPVVINLTTPATVGTTIATPILRTMSEGRANVPDVPVTNTPMTQIRPPTPPLVQQRNRTSPPETNTARRTPSPANPPEPHTPSDTPPSIRIEATGDRMVESVPAVAPETAVTTQPVPPADPHPPVPTIINVPGTGTTNPEAQEVVVQTDSEDEVATASIASEA